MAGRLDRMGYHENGLIVLVNLAEHTEKIIRRLGIKGPGGLIGQDESGMGNQRSRNRGALLLASGYLIGKFFQDIGNSQLGGNGRKPLLFFSPLTSNILI